MSISNYSDVQIAINNFVETVGVFPAGAPHQDFWNMLTHQQFITDNVPGVAPAFKILVVGDSASSTLIQILKGVGDAANIFGQMPRYNPPYEPEQSKLITDLSAWIDAGCPN